MRPSTAGMPTVSVDRVTAKTVVPLNKGMEKEPKSMSKRIERRLKYNATILFGINKIIANVWFTE